MYDYSIIVHTFRLYLGNIYTYIHTYIYIYIYIYIYQPLTHWVSSSCSPISTISSGISINQLSPAFLSPSSPHCSNIFPEFKQSTHLCSPIQLMAGVYSSKTEKTLKKHCSHLVILKDFKLKKPSGKLRVT